MYFYQLVFSGPDLVEFSVLITPSVIYVYQIRQIIYLNKKRKTRYFSILWLYFSVLWHTYIFQIIYTWSLNLWCKILSTFCVYLNTLLLLLSPPPPDIFRHLETVSNCRDKPKIVGKCQNMTKNVEKFKWLSTVLK